MTPDICVESISLVNMLKYICDLCQAEHEINVLYCRNCREYTSASGCFTTKEVDDGYELYEGDEETDEG